MFSIVIRLKYSRLRKWVTLLKGSFTHPGDPPIISIRPKRKHFQWNSAIKKLRSHVNCFLYLGKQKTASGSHILLAFVLHFTDWFKYIFYKDFFLMACEFGIKIFQCISIQFSVLSLFINFLFWKVKVVMTFNRLFKICSLRSALSGSHLILLPVEI